MKYITDPPPSKGDPTLPDWEIWDALFDSFSQQSNVSRDFELYEKFFTTKQSGKPLSKYYSSLKSLWDLLLQHRPFTSDLAQQKRYWEDFMLASLLFGLDSELRGFKDQILASETLPMAANAYSHLSRSSLGQSSNVSLNVAPILGSSAFVSSTGVRGNFHGHGRANSRGGIGRNFCGSSRGGGRTDGRGDRKCNHCHATNHLSLIVGRSS
ncbi:hypothetical protein RHGRI_011155 [Rhododendron griersonianum]|uniref:Retrotransposon gag domain-containing protein n=1 Tax=Rhododendron griersonianum TaxID=479676 RepID=A0AAV6KKR1_9ERIC|nr:hypothetical protein RHGRI_011155 [Rhododendron griersonianum]